VRDVARVMDIPYADADKVAKAIPPALDMTLDKALEENPALREMASATSASRNCSRSRGGSRA
jgi:DNA polymerase III subunit alpha